jgi:acyl-CoA synthetase (AMP-forming)/AMP-acid ligase II
VFDFNAIKTVADIPRVQARLRPQETASVFARRKTSFADLDAASSRVANGLIAAGVKPGDRIAVYSKNSDLYLEVFFGALKARATAVGMNNRLAAPEVAYVLKDSGAKVMFVSQVFAETATKALAEATTNPLTISLDAEAGPWPSYQAWKEQQAAADPHLDNHPDDDAIQLYTSGTTGMPKGVQITNENYRVFFDLGFQAGWANYDVASPVLIAMPMFHVAGINSAVLAAAQGARNVIMEEVNPFEILRLIPEQRIEHAFLVPAVVNMLLQVPGCADVDFSSLKNIYYGASPISEDVLLRAQATLGCNFTQLYGMTESLGSGTYLPPEAHDPARGKLRSCGIAWPGHTIECRRDDGTACAVGEVGEIVIKSNTIMKGYWNRADATKDTVRDGWLHTGDAGYMDADGYLFIHDRVKDMIVSGGENIYPAEVENAIFGHPAVADVAVIGVPDEKWGEAVKAIVVAKPDAKIDPASIIAWARERIAAYKVPKSVDTIAVLPRNPSGKVLRRELREPYWAGHTRRVG